MEWRGVTVPVSRATGRALGTLPTQTRSTDRAVARCEEWVAGPALWRLAAQISDLDRIQMTCSFVFLTLLVDRMLHAS